MSVAGFPLRSSVVAGDWVVVSGQVGVRDGVLVEGHRAQTRQALDNLAAELDQHDLTLADVVKTTVFLTTMDHYAGMNAEYGPRFEVDPPARTAVAVHELPAGSLVEIEAWARRAVDASAHAGSPC